ncbi:hypothetical protein [uncultured Megasphaera sp.]|nr:hypothetical protein [uncultured Megasphaera sp.]
MIRTILLAMAIIAWGQVILHDRPGTVIVAFFFTILWLATSLWVYKRQRK